MVNGWGRTGAELVLDRHTIAQLDRNISAQEIVGLQTLFLPAF